jgi:hypothetical protein
MPGVAAAGHNWAGHDWHHGHRHFVRGFGVGGWGWGWGGYDDGYYSDPAAYSGYCSYYSYDAYGNTYCADTGGITFNVVGW